MFTSLYRAAGQFDDPAFRKILWQGVWLALLSTIALAGVSALALYETPLFDIRWLNWIKDLLGGLAVLLLPLLLFPAVVTVILSFFLEGIAQTVERRHYPELGPARTQGWGEILATSLRFFGLSLGINLVALILVYWIPGLNLVFFLLLNGFLLGREYFEIAAFRRLPPDQASALRHAHGGRIWLGGAAIALVMGIPLLNLAAPVFATAFMVHELESLRRKHGLL